MLCADMGGSQLQSEAASSQWVLVSTDIPSGQSGEVRRECSAADESSVSTPTPSQSAGDTLGGGHLKG